MTRKIFPVLLMISVIFFSFCKKEVKTIPNYLRKGTVEYHTNQGNGYLNQGSLNIAMEQFKKALLIDCHLFVPHCSTESIFLLS